eukprot:3860336-Amphidinium_carterae.1
MRHGLTTPPATHALLRDNLNRHRQWSLAKCWCDALRHMGRLFCASQNSTLVCIETMSSNCKRITRIVRLLISSKAVKSKETIMTRTIVIV